MLAELKYIHGMLRGDLSVVRELARSVAHGAAAQDVRAEIAALASEHGLRALQVNCLHYCNFVHGHHGLEDAVMFQRIRAVNPAIGPVVDTLEADHRRVADLIDAVVAATEALLSVDSLPGEARQPEADAAARAEVVRVLDELAAHLLAHLAYEEEVLAPTMVRMRGWER